LESPDKVHYGQFEVIYYLQYDLLFDLGHTLFSKKGFFLREHQQSTWVYLAITL